MCLCVCDKCRMVALIDSTEEQNDIMIFWNSDYEIHQFSQFSVATVLQFSSLECRSDRLCRRTEWDFEATVTMWTPPMQPVPVRWKGRSNLWHWSLTGFFKDTLKKLTELKCRECLNYSLTIAAFCVWRCLHVIVLTCEEFLSFPASRKKLGSGDDIFRTGCRRESGPACPASGLKMCLGLVRYAYSSSCA